MGVQVVKIRADLVHFHSIPSALESIMGGVDLAGNRIAADAKAAMATVSKERFIVVTPIADAVTPGASPIALMDQQLISATNQLGFTTKGK